jgi:hypothetical protein
MSRGSFGRTVARAAASGGSRSYRARPPIFFYLSVALIVIAGIGLIVYSRSEVTSSASASATGPTTSDNWYTAVGFDVCGTLEPNLPANTNLATAGIRTFGDGIINTNPSSVPNSSAFTGSHATLGTFVSTYGQGLGLSRTTLSLPVLGSRAHAASSSTSTTTTSVPANKKKAAAGTKKAATSTTALQTTKPASKTPGVTSRTPSKRYSTGQTCAHGPYAGQKAAVEVETWPSPSAPGSLFIGDPSALRLRNGEMITVAFLPPGVTIPPPRSKSTLEQDLGKK